MENELVESVIEEAVPAEQSAQDSVAPKKQSKEFLDNERVNAIVKRAKMEAYEKAKREYAAELEALKANNQQPVEQEVVATPSNGGDDISKLVDERLARIAQEHKLRVEREAEEQRLRQIADAYFQKMEKGPELFEDFEEVMKGFNPAKNADIIELAHDFDNLPQVMYELANNRLKAAELRRLAKDDPEDAKYELQRLAKSISSNEEARSQYTPARPPLTKPKASNVGTESGRMSLKDFKNASWNKF